MGFVIVALLLLTRAGEGAAYFPELFVPFALMGLGMGTAMLPLLTIAMSGVPEADAGLGSGILNVSMQLAGALGIAVLGTLAAERTSALTGDGASVASALTGGYHLGFEIAAGAVAVGLVLAADGAAGPGPRAGRGPAQRSPSRSESRGGFAPARSHVRAATTQAKVVAARTAAASSSASRSRPFIRQ